MEYYDSINSKDPYTYYLNRNNKMLVNESVLAVLDQLHKDKKNPINLFEDKNDFKIKEKVVFESHDLLDDLKSNMSQDTTTSTKQRSNTNVKKAENVKLKEHAENIVKSAISNLSERFSALGKNWINQLDDQNSELKEKIENQKLDNQHFSRRGSVHRKGSGMRNSTKMDESIAKLGIIYIYI